ncbi:hypothetical protein Xekj_04359 [Xenorhabdus sp. KJ12.1]|nr:hypothetical protein Xekj_04359 [Xenorhabdus sp. KJ12.1]
MSFGAACLAYRVNDSTVLNRPSSLMPFLAKKAVMPNLALDSAIPKAAAVSMPFILSGAVLDDESLNAGDFG